MAKQFLTKSNRAHKADSPEQDPVDRKGLVKMLAPRHKQAKAMNVNQHRLQDAQKQAQQPHKLKLSAVDSKQVKMAKEMAQQALAATTAVQPHKQQPSKEHNIESLFKPAPTKQANKHQSLRAESLSKQDRFSKDMQQQFMKVENSRTDSKGNEKRVVPDTRASVQKLLRVRGGSISKQQVRSGTSEADKMEGEFAAEKKMQMKILEHMKQQQRASAAELPGDKKLQSESDLRNLFAVHGKNRAAANHQWSKQQVRIATQKAEHKQADESQQLENHLHTVEEVVAPKVVPAVKSATQSAPISLAQQDVGTITPQTMNGPAVMRKKFTQSMRNHFVELLEHNKDKFKHMMNDQGVDGAATFYENMKTDLQAMLQPQQNVLIQTAAGTDSKAIQSTGTQASKPPGKDTAAQVTPVATKAEKTKATKVIKMKAAKTVEPVPITAARLGEAKPSTATTEPPKMDLKSLEQAVDMLSPADRNKFIMHRLAKLAA